MQCSYGFGELWTFLVLNSFLKILDLQDWDQVKMDFRLHFQSQHIMLNIFSGGQLYVHPALSYIYNDLLSFEV